MLVRSNNGTIIANIMSAGEKQTLKKGGDFNEGI